MSTSIIDKVNKMGADDGNQTLRFFEHHKMEYGFLGDRMDEEPSKEQEKVIMNLPISELVDSNNVDQDEELNVDDMAEISSNQRTMKMS